MIDSFGRLKQEMDMQNISQSEIVDMMQSKGFRTCTQQRMSDYAHGRRNIPLDIALELSAIFNKHCLYFAVKDWERWK